MKIKSIISVFILSLLIMGFIVTLPVSRLMAEGTEESLLLTFEIPLSYSFSKASDGSALETEGIPAGLLVSLKFPTTGFGVGLNSYEVKTAQSTDSSIKTQMVDIFYSMDAFTLNLAVGYGYGNSEITGDHARSYDKSPSSRYYMRAGIPISTGTFLNLSIHFIRSKISLKDSDYQLEAGGTMAAIGTSIGF